MEYRTIKLLKEETYRIPPLVNTTDNMVRVTFTCSRNEWHEIKRQIMKNSTDAKGLRR